MDSKSNEEEFLRFTHTDIGDVCDTETEMDSNQGGGIFKPSQTYDHLWLPEFSYTPEPTNIDQEASEVDIFIISLSDEVIQLMVVETDQYTNNVKTKLVDTAKPNTQIRTWKNMCLMK